jgi:hypothetical protein
MLFTIWFLPTFLVIQLGMIWGFAPELCRQTFGLSSALPLCSFCEPLFPYPSGAPAQNQTKVTSLTEREGFEPSVRRKLVQRISNQPLSTTQPSLLCIFAFVHTPHHPSRPKHLCPLSFVLCKRKSPQMALPFHSLVWKGTKKSNHPGTKLMFPARLPTSLSTSSEFHSQVRDGLAWFH